jgi:hypothetical protein
LVEFVETNVVTESPSHRGEVDDGVGGSPNRAQCNQSVSQVSGCHLIRGAVLVTYELNTSLAEKAGNGVVARITGGN